MATITAISGRNVTVENDGASADYLIKRKARVTLNGNKATLADLENGDEVIIGGITADGAEQVIATRDSNKRPKAITPSTTMHFPPRGDDTSLANKRKEAHRPPPLQDVGQDKEVKSSKEELDKPINEEELKEPIQQEPTDDISTSEDEPKSDDEESPPVASPPKKPIHHRRR